MMGAMYLVLLAWGYVALMMAGAEATADNGTLLGAFVTLVLYGLLPIGLIGYLMDAPRRRRARAAAQQAQSADGGLDPASVDLPDAGGEPAGTAAGADPVTTVREEP